MKNIFIYIICLFYSITLWSQKPIYNTGCNEIVKDSLVFQYGQFEFNLPNEIVIVKSEKELKTLWKSYSTPEITMPKCNFKSSNMVIVKIRAGTCGGLIPESKSKIRLNVNLSEIFIYIGGTRCNALIVYSMFFVLPKNNLIPKVVICAS